MIVKLSETQSFSKIPNIFLEDQMKVLSTTTALKESTSISL